MLISELLGQGLLITYDNPKPDYTAIKTALGQLGHLIELEVKTTVFLHPRADVTVEQVRDVVDAHLQPNGAAAIVAISRGRALQKAAGQAWGKII